MVKKSTETEHKIKLKDLGTWLKIAVIGWLVYLGMLALSILITTINLIAGTAE